MKKLFLSNGNHTEVDEDLYEELSMFRWHENSAGYALRNEGGNGNRRQILLHRQITNAPKGYSVDHIDGNPLNNSLENLRVCTHKQNLRNQKKRKGSNSKYKGVTVGKNKTKETWVVRITAGDKMQSLGTFDNEHDAARMYNFWALDLYGEFARLNVIKEETA